MKVERFLEAVGEHHGQTVKLLCLRAFLCDEAARLAAGDPGLSFRLFEQASALTRDILRAQEKHDELVFRVCRFIQRLTDQTERETLKLCYLSRVSAQTAAGILGCSAGMALRIRQRALMHLEGLGF